MLQEEDVACKIIADTLCSITAEAPAADRAVLEKISELFAHTPSRAINIQRARDSLLICLRKEERTAINSRYGDLLHAILVVMAVYWPLNTFREKLPECPIILNAVNSDKRIVLVEGYQYCAEEEVTEWLYTQRLSPITRQPLFRRDLEYMTAASLERRSDSHFHRRQVRAFSGSPAQYACLIYVGLNLMPGSLNFFLSCTLTLCLAATFPGAVLLAVIAIAVPFMLVWSIIKLFEYFQAWRNDRIPAISLQADALLESVQQQFKREKGTEAQKNLPVPLGASPAHRGLFGISPVPQQSAAVMQVEGQVCDNRQLSRKGLLYAACTGA